MGKRKTSSSLRVVVIVTKLLRSVVIRLRQRTVVPTPVISALELGLVVKGLASLLIWRVRFHLVLEEAAGCGLTVRLALVHTPAVKVLLLVRRVVVQLDLVQEAHLAREPELLYTLSDETVARGSVLVDEAFPHISHHLGMVPGAVRPSGHVSAIRIVVMETFLDKVLEEVTAQGIVPTEVGQNVTRHGAAEDFNTASFLQASCEVDRLLVLIGTIPSVPSGIRRRVDWDGAIDDTDLVRVLATIWRLAPTNEFNVRIKETVLN